jgi:hypothetical protein
MKPSRASLPALYIRLIGSGGHRLMDPVLRQPWPLLLVPFTRRRKSWCSDAVVAVRYGSEGKIYARAFEVPATEWPRLAATARVFPFGADRLAAGTGGPGWFRGRTPEILGWAERHRIDPERGQRLDWNGLTPSADPRLWDPDVVMAASGFDLERYWPNNRPARPLERLSTELSADEITLAVEMVDETDEPPTTLGALLAEEINDPIRAAARDQLGLAILERSARQRAPSRLRPLGPGTQQNPRWLAGMDPVDRELAHQGLEVNNSLSETAPARLLSARLLADLATGQGARHYQAFGVHGPTFIESYPAERAGLFEVRADFRNVARSNPETAREILRFVVERAPELGQVLQFEADGFAARFTTPTQAAGEELRALIDDFARAHFLLPLTED